MKTAAAVAAIEFAIIAPIMLLAFFGTVEFCSAIAVDRKVTLVARTLSDLTSQNVGVTDAQLTAYFTVSQKILWPYTNTPKATITELHIEPGSLAPRVQWSVGTNQHSVGSDSHYSLRAPGLRHLPDLQRSHLQIHSDGRLFAGGSGHRSERRCLYAAASE